MAGGAIDSRIDNGVDSSVDNLEWLAGWYGRQCDGYWEHARGLHLQRLRYTGSGPSSSASVTASESHGWQLRIELTGTSAAGCEPRSLALYCIDGGWLRCALTGARFDGSGDAQGLEKIIGVFRQWVAGARDNTSEREEREAVNGG